MTVGDRIKERRQSLGITIDELSFKLNKNRATIYRYESNEIENLPTTVLEPLAKALGTTPAYLMGWEEKQAPLKKDFDIFSVEGIIPVPNTHKVPLIGNIACGTPILAEENIDKYIDVAENIKADFCLRCNGDSMINARIYDGDLVFVRKQPVVDDGDIAVVLIDNEATLKRVFKNESGLILQAENPSYPPMMISGERLNEVWIQGKAIAFLSVIN